jgi:hypothetical protein
MKILYFSNDYSPHDHRFLSAIRDGGHEAFHLRLQANLRQVEDRPVPAGVQNGRAGRANSVGRICQSMS